MPPVRQAVIAIACHALLSTSAGHASPLSFSGDWTQFLAASVVGSGDFRSDNRFPLIGT
jgi:hypothetical protein